MVIASQSSHLLLLNQWDFVLQYFYYSRNRKVWIFWPEWSDNELIFLFRLIKISTFKTVTTCVVKSSLCLCCFPLAFFLAANCNWQVSSLSETKAHQLLQQKAASFIHFNQQQLSRIYPSSYRVDSSNFNPQPFWNAGCQLGMTAIARQSLNAYQWCSTSNAAPAV